MEDFTTEELMLLRNNASFVILTGLPEPFMEMHKKLKEKLVIELSKRPDYKEVSDKHIKLSLGYLSKKDADNS